MAASNLLFSALALAGPVEWLYAITVVDGFKRLGRRSPGRFYICNLRFSASICIIDTLNPRRTTLSSNSGLLVDAMDGNWALFFAITTVMITPSLYLLWRIRDRLPNAHSEHKAQ